MSKKNKLFLIALVIAIVISGMYYTYIHLSENYFFHNVNANESDTESIVVCNENNQYVHTEGNLLKLGDSPYIIHGMCASNAVAASPSEPNNNMMSEQDYKELSEMGINTVRFLFNYNILEDDENPYTYKESGWLWFDQNIEWAEKYQIKIILDCHLSQGGIPENGGNDNVWCIGSENQERLVAMWAAISERYSSCTTVLGYGLLNEPVISRLESNQWTKLAQRITNIIRKSDKNHIIIVQRAKIKKSNDYIVPEIEDNNWMIEIHKYPTLNMKYDNDINIACPDFKYGNTDIISSMDNNQNINTDVFSVNKDENGITNEWHEYQFVSNAEKESNNAYLSLAVSDIKKGQSVEIKDLRVEESDTGKVVYSIENNYANKYSYYSKNNTTKIDYAANQRIITFSGYTQYADVADDSIFRYFQIENGKSYKIIFKARTIGLKEQEAKIIVSLNYYKADVIHKMDQTYLSDILDSTLLRETYNVPIFYGEIGVKRELYERQDVQLMFEDVLDWFHDNDINFAWFSWHEPNYGIYASSGLAPKDNYNETLAEQIKSSIKNKG